MQKIARALCLLIFVTVSAIQEAFQKAKISTTTVCSPWSISDRHNPQLWQEVLALKNICEHRRWHNILRSKPCRKNPE
jgi:hypothetical protein